MSDGTTPQLIALGEAMILLAPTDATGLLDATDLHIDVGGAEANVAAHAAALGISAAWISAVGADVWGERMVRTLGERGVDMCWVREDPAAPTGVYFKDPGNGVLYYRSGSAASRMGPDTLGRLPLERGAVVHVSGITPALSESCAALTDAAVARVASARGESTPVAGARGQSTAGVQLSFDVNYRPPLWSVADAAPRLLELSRQSDIVFVGRDEASVLWGTETAEDVRALIPAPTTLVVKDAEVGATEFGREGTTFVPSEPVTVVEAVGAGDAFAAGYLAATLRGAGAAERLRAGHQRAALVLQSTTDFVATGALPVVRQENTHDLQ